MDSVSNQSMRAAEQQVQTPPDEQVGAQSTDPNGLSMNLRAARQASSDVTTANAGSAPGESGPPPAVARSSVFNRNSPHHQALSSPANASLQRSNALDYLRKLVSVNGIGSALRKAFVNAIDSYVAAAQTASSISDDDALKAIMFEIRDFDESERLTAIRIFADCIPRDRRNFGNGECMTWLREIFRRRADVETATKLLGIVSLASEVTQAQEDVRNAVRAAVADGKDATMPESFLVLTEEGRRQVAKLTVDWVLTPINRDTPKWFFAFTGRELMGSPVIYPYLKKTVSLGLSRNLGNIPELRSVASALRRLNMTGA